MPIKKIHIITQRGEMRIFFNSIMGRKTLKEKREQKRKERRKEGREGKEREREGERDVGRKREREDGRERERNREKESIRIRQRQVAPGNPSNHFQPTPMGNS